MIIEESRRGGVRSFEVPLDQFTRVTISVERCQALPDEPHDLQPSPEPVTNREALQACVTLANHFLKLF